nr:ribosomal protein L7Ae/L30e/S12e/Gadd45 [Tanacetum cinerariifolium]
MFELGGHRDHLPTSLAHMLYCIVAKEQYNLAYVFVKRFECARATPTANLPYGMFLTCLFRYIMEHYPHLDNGIYNVVDRVMRLHALKQTRKPQSDRGKPKARHSVSSSFGHHLGSSFHHEEDDEDEGTSRASTPSPTTNLNSLQLLNYQRYDIPTSSKQDDDLLFERQTDLLNQTQQIHKEVRGGFKSFGKALPKINIIPLKQLFIDLTNYDTKTPSPNNQVLSPSSPNTPSKTPSIIYTSSSFIDYKPKSPTSSTSPSTKGYLNPPMSPPPRVPPPPPTQEDVSMDITLTLLPITPFDVQFNTPSPPSHLFGHPIPWNLLEAHGDSCLRCIHNHAIIFGLRDELQHIFSYIEHMLSRPSFPNTPPPSISPN